MIGIDLSHPIYRSVTATTEARREKPRNNVRIRKRLRPFLVRPNMVGLRNRISSNWPDSASPKSGLHAGEAKLWTFMDMNTRGAHDRLGFGCVLVLLTGYGCVQMLVFWPRYAASGKAAELVIRVFVPAVMAAGRADRVLAHQAVGMDPCSDHGRYLMPPGPMVFWICPAPMRAAVIHVLAFLSLCGDRATIMGTHLSRPAKAKACFLCFS